MCIRILAAAEIVGREVDLNAPRAVDREKWVRKW
jgi:hypothetical protein